MRAWSCVALPLALAMPAMAADLPSEVALFNNVNIFDGENDKLLEGYDVLVVRNLIKQAAKDIPTSGTYELEIKTGRLAKTILLPGAPIRCTVEEKGRFVPLDKQEWEEDHLKKVPNMQTDDGCPEHLNLHGTHR